MNTIGNHIGTVEKVETGTDEDILEWKDPSFYCNSSNYEFKVIQKADTRGGIPIIKGTRVGVYEVAAMAEKNSIERILKGYPSLNQDMVEKSIEYAKNNPPAIHS